METQNKIVQQVVVGVVSIIVAALIIKLFKVKI